MPRPRLTLRRLMIAVAVVAVGLGGIQSWRRWAYCMNLAQAHSLRARLEREMADFPIPGPSDFDPQLVATEEDRRDPAAMAARHHADAPKTAAWHERLANECSHAALRPWLLVPTEPPLVTAPAPVPSE